MDLEGLDSFTLAPSGLAGGWDLRSAVDVVVCT
jgi:hypothetical protein